MGSQGHMLGTATAPSGGESPTFDLNSLPQNSTVAFKIIKGDMSAEVLRGIAKLKNADNVAGGDDYTIVGSVPNTICPGPEHAPGVEEWDDELFEERNVEDCKLLSQ